MDIEAASVRERRLARELRQLRVGAALHGKDAAQRLGWSASKISRIETGRTGVSGADLAQLMELYDVPAEQAASLAALAPAARPRGWWDAYADTLSAGYAGLIRMEAGSRALQSYCAVVPHALLQTAPYSREVIRTTWRRPAETEVERRVQVCQRRQQVLAPDRDPPLQLSVVLDEAVLRRQLADEAVARGQVRHLLEAAQWPHVTLQVLPFRAGLPPVTAGSFSVLESLATRAADVVYLENKTRIFFIESEAEVHGYAREFELVAARALDVSASQELLGSLL